MLFYGQTVVSLEKKVGLEVIVRTFVGRVILLSLPGFMVAGELD